MASAALCPSIYLTARRGGQRGAGGSSTDAKIAANIDLDQIPPGTGSVSCNSVFVRYLGHFLNQEELMEPEAAVQNPSSHCRDLPCCKMHPDKIMGSVPQLL